jgi:putative Mg2+ transporter-C (MgtC) family protein
VHWEEALSPTLWSRIALALACGSALGLERQVRGKPAGIRTSVLVCLGTLTFVRLGVELDGNADPGRVLGQVVTGIGFLGAGVILTQGGLVKGVTSAAVVWVLAAVGAAIGLDRAGFAVSLTAVALAALLGVEGLERIFSVLRRGVHRPDSNSGRGPGNE